MRIKYLTGDESGIFGYRWESDAGTFSTFLFIFQERLGLVTPFIRDP